MIVLNVKSWQN